MKLTDMIVPLIILLIMLTGLIRGKDITKEFTDGAKEGLKTTAELVPILVLLMTAVGIFTASGAAEMLCGWLSPITELIGFPKECVELALIRPVSGSGAIAVLDSLLSRISPDCFEGRTASVLMSSTETTFYTIAVYSAALKKKPDKRLFIAAAAADLTGFLMAGLTVKLMFGQC